MADYNELRLEQEIAEHLAAQGWLYSTGDSGYDNRELALVPEDDFGWLTNTQPDDLARVLKRDTRPKSAIADPARDKAGHASGVGWWRSEPAWKGARRTSDADSRCASFGLSQR